MKEKKILNIIGIFFLIIGIASISRIFFPESTWQNIFWICGHTTLIMGLAIIFRNKFWLTAELNIILIPQIIWTIDYLGKLIFDKFLFGFTTYMFEGNWIFKILSYQHLFVFILTIYAVYLIKPSKKAWIGSIIHGIFLLSSGLIISEHYNINCAHRNCLNFQIPHYLLIWIITFLIMTILTNIILIKLFKKKRTNKEKTLKKKQSKKNQ
jgi:hypothetical protein